MISIRHLFCAMILCMSILILVYFLDLSYSNVKYNMNLHRRSFQSNTIQSSLLPSVSKYQKPFRNKNYNEIIIALVVCGDRLQEAFVSIKSALVFQLKQSLRIIVLADEELILSLEEKLSDWQELRNNTFKYEIHHLEFPKTKGMEWKALFKKCASQRLFLPDILTHVDSLLYVDTDTLFLSPIEDVWQHFNLMNATHMSALAPEHEDPNSGWYNRFARHPFYGKLGVNSGVMLMNLTRMRTFGWNKYVEPIYNQFKNKLSWGDQDIINIIFYYHPEKLYIYPCKYNFRPDHCMYMSVCDSATDLGVSVLHGSRSVFHSNKQPAFSAIFQAFQEYQLNTDPYENLFLPAEVYLENTKSTNCGSNYHNVFLKIMKEVIKPIS